MKQIALILSFTLVSALPAFALTPSLLPKAYKILSEGKILHKEVHYQKGSAHTNSYGSVTANQIIFIQYVIIHNKGFYDCWIKHQYNSETDTPLLNNVECRLMTELPTLPPYYD